MKLGSSVLGVAAFVGIVSWSTLYLQRTLILYHAVGWHLHWGAILLLIPLIVGLLFRVLAMSFAFTGSLLGGVISALIVYPQYRDHFFKEPPHPLAAVLFALITSGVAYSMTLSLREKLAIMGRFRANSPW